LLVVPTVGWCRFQHESNYSTQQIGYMVIVGKAKDVVALYISLWAKSEPLQQKMILIENIKAIPIAEQFTGRHILCCNREGKKPFQIPFFATENTETDLKLSSTLMCKHSLAVLHSYGGFVFFAYLVNRIPAIAPILGPLFGVLFRGGISP
jgi:hypothetical protein